MTTLNYKAKRRRKKNSLFDHPNNSFLVLKMIHGSSVSK